MELMVLHPHHHNRTLRLVELVELMVLELVLPSAGAAEAEAVGPSLAGLLELVLALLLPLLLPLVFPQATMEQAET